MGLVNNDPIDLTTFYRVPVAHHITLTLAIDAFANVAFVSEDFEDIALCPEVFFVDARPTVTGTSRSPFVQHRCWNTLTVEHGGDFRRSYSVNRQCEDLPNNFCRFLINNKAVFIFGVFHITIRSKGAEKQAFFCSHTLCIFDLSRKLSAVEVIDQRFERGIKAVDVLRSGTVETVVDGNETDTKKRKYTADVVADHEIITPETGKVFDYDTMYLPLLYLFHHSEKIRSFKVLTTPTVITELGDFPTAELGTTADKALQQSSLIGYTFGFGFAGIL